MEHGTLRNGMWWPCFVRPRQAIGVAAALTAAGLPAICLTHDYVRRVPRANRVQRISRPMIGGMIFLTTAAPWPLPRRMLAGCDVSTMRRMNVAGVPVVIVDAALEAMRNAAAQSNDRRTSYSAGDRVAITLGPLAGYRGTVRKVRGERVAVLLDSAVHEIDMGAFLLAKSV